jgi:hypothetical protein
MMQWNIIEILFFVPILILIWAMCVGICVGTCFATYNLIKDTFE